MTNWIVHQKINNREPSYIFDLLQGPELISQPQTRSQLVQEILSWQYLARGPMESNTSPFLWAYVPHLKWINASLLRQASSSCSIQSWCGWVLAFKRASLGHVQCPRRFLGIIGQNPECFQFYRVPCCNLSVSFIKVWHIPIGSSNLIGSLPKS